MEQVEECGGEVMFYGIPGCGKTGLGAAWAQELWERTGKLCLYIDWDNGLRSIQNLVRAQFIRPNKDNPIDECNKFIQMLRSGEWSGLVDDTTSYLSEYVLLPYMIEQEYFEKKRMGFITPGGTEVRQATMTDYGFAETQTSQYLKGLKAAAMDSGTAVLSLCHNRAIEMSTEKGVVLDPIVGPAFAGKKLTRQIDNTPDLVARIQLSRQGEGVRYHFTAQGDGLYKGKDRLRCIPPGGFDMTVPFKAANPEQMREWEVQWIARGRMVCGAILDKLGIKKEVQA